VIRSTAFAVLPGARVTSLAELPRARAAAAPIWVTGVPPASATPG